MDGNKPALEGHNKEFVKRIAELKIKRSELQMQIHDDESQQDSYQQQLDMVRQRITQLRVSIARRAELRDGYDTIIDNTERAYDDIMQESHNLLSQLNATTDAMANFSINQSETAGGFKLYNSYSDASALV